MRYRYTTIQLLFFVSFNFISAMPLTAAQSEDAPVSPQSIEAIKQMGDELEADRKAREAEYKKKQNAADTVEDKTDQPTTQVSSEPVSAARLQELKQQCDDAREQLIAPLRKAAIDECIGKKVKTPAQCEQFYKDYGGSGTTLGGGFRQRMFHDIPECKPLYEAEKAAKTKSQ